MLYKFYYLSRSSNSMIALLSVGKSSYASFLNDFMLFFSFLFFVVFVSLIRLLLYISL